MGAPTSLTLKWIPEDDLLLKNAVEAGASLESLAKGAVQFSRRFSFQELQDRWHALLYDLDTSTEVSARIIEMEIESSLPNYSKGNRTCSSRGKEYLFGKRRRDSVQSLYYSMRKRICNEPRTSAGVRLLPRRSHNCNPNFVTSRKNSKSHFRYPAANYPPATDSAFGATMDHHYGHPEADYDNGYHALPERPNGDSASSSGTVAVNDLHMGHFDSIEDGLQDAVVDKESTLGYEENIVQAVDTSGQENADQPFEQGNDIHSIHEENLVSLNASSDVQELRPAQSLDKSDKYETDDNHEMLCSGFVGNHNFVSQVPECTTSFHQLSHTSPNPAPPIWRTTEGSSVPSMQIEEHFDGNIQGERACLLLSTKDIKTVDSPGCDVGNSGIKLNDDFNSPAIISETEFMDFSFDDELFLIHVNEKDIADTSCLEGLNSILLNSPSDTHQNNVSNAGCSSTSEALNIDPLPLNSDFALPYEPNDPQDQIFSSNDHQQNIHVSDNIVSTVAEECRIIDPLEGFVLCVINTEDTEIPDNDHLFPSSELPPPFSSYDLEQSFMNSPGPSFRTSTLFADGKASLGERRVVKEEQVASAEIIECSLKAGSLVSLNCTSIHSSDGPLKSDSIAGASFALNSGQIAAKSVESVDHGIHGTNRSLSERPVQRCGYANTLLDVADGCQQETDIKFTRRQRIGSCAELASAEMLFPDSVAVAASDQEKQLSDSEGDVPNYSDIEAMILEMDLGPYDQETSLLHKEVSRYQGLDSKKATVRLEQGARSYMHRAMSSRGAFAVLYGRHLKYYIKTPKVLLGRATEDVDVDIDLGREGRANKVSRRQAIIKMKEDGQFTMLNVGRFSIFVNNREVLPRKRVNLTSCCLIEIRGMRFIFEVNESTARCHAYNTLDSSQDQKTRFDWTS